MKHNVLSSPERNFTLFLAIWLLEDFKNVGTHLSEREKDLQSSPPFDLNTTLTRVNSLLNMPSQAVLTPYRDTVLLLANPCRLHHQSILKKSETLRENKGGEVFTRDGTPSPIIDGEHHVA